METKGSTIQTTRDFIKENFPLKYNAWIDSLPEESKNHYLSTVDYTGWYPMISAYVIPLKNMALICYDNDSEKAGVEIGKFSADIAIKGMYKAFLLVSSPWYMMRRASKIFTTFYMPCEMTVEKTGKSSVLMKIIGFNETNEVIEYRIIGWCIRALELASCKNCGYKLEKSIAKGDDITEVIFFWD